MKRYYGKIVKAKRNKALDLFQLKKKIIDEVYEQEDIPIEQLMFREQMLEFAGNRIQSYFTMMLSLALGVIIGTGTENIIATIIALAGVILFYSFFFFESKILFKSHASRKMYIDYELKKIKKYKEKYFFKH